jgi:beta-alanine degradation protein BauB
VLDYRDRPGDRTKPHRHPDSVMITLTGFQRRISSGEVKGEGNGKGKGEGKRGNQDVNRDRDQDGNQDRDQDGNQDRDQDGNQDRDQDGDGTAEIAMTPGRAVWLPAQEHAGHNTGTTDTHVIFVELKGFGAAGIGGHLGPAQ